MKRQRCACGATIHFDAEELAREEDESLHTCPQNKASIVKRTILLVPPEGDPHGLLAPGRAGARPPMWRRARSDFDLACGWDIGGPCELERDYDRPEDLALVLALDGEAVPEGCDRAARVISRLHVGKSAPYTVYGFAPCGHYEIVSRGAGYPYGVMDLVAAWEASGFRAVIIDPTPAAEPSSSELWLCPVCTPYQGDIRSVLYARSGLCTAGHTLVRTALCTPPASELG